MSNALTTLTSKLAERLDMGDGAGLLETLKATAFKSQIAVTDAQMTALMVVANQYGLNPWTKEIYAFPDKGGIVPIVGVDGWARIINSHAQFDGMDFEQDGESCTCIIYRKDRNHPTKVTEWMSECKRENAQPWKSHPKRMLRHKAMIQCSRLAFGFTGIYDQDEAERIVEATAIDSEPAAPRIASPKTKVKDEATTVEARTTQTAPASTDAPKPVAAGQLKWIEQKCKSLGVEVDEAIKAGNAESLDTLTPEQFDAVKAHLMSL